MSIRLSNKSHFSTMMTHEQKTKKIKILLMNSPRPEHELFVQTYY